MILPDPAWPEATRSACLAPLFQAGGDSPEQSEAGVWLFTSGTTGIPKARHRTVAELGEMVDRVLSRMPRPLREGRPVSLCIVPLYHGYGLVNALLLILAVGGTVALEDGFRPRRAARLIREQGVEVLYGTRALYRLLADHALWGDGERLRLRWCVSSTGWLEQEVARKFADHAGCPVRQQYGTTETGPLCLDSEPIPSGLEYCVGLPLPGVVIGVRDEEGRVLPPGESGRLVVRFATGWAPTLEREGEGFFRLEDRGMLDDEGRVFVYHDPTRWRRWTGGGASTGERV
jgi:long-chain acyl-CoA synthetase